MQGQVGRWRCVPTTAHCDGRTAPALDLKSYGLEIRTFHRRHVPHRYHLALEAPERVK